MSFVPTNNNQSGGGGIFGGTNNSTANSTTNSNASAFGSAPAAGSIFGGGPTSSTGSRGLFGGSNFATSTNPTSSTVTPAQPGGGLFGNSNSTPTLGSGGGLFGGGSLFGGANATSAPGTTSSVVGGPNTSTPTTGTTGGLFSGASTIPGPNNLFGGANANLNTGNPTPAQSTNTSPLFGGSSAFTLPKPGDTGAKASSSFFGQPSTTPSAGASGATGANPASTVGSGLFSLPPKPAGTTSPAVPSSNATTTPNLFGGGLFGQTAASTSTSGAAASPLSLGGNKDPPAPSINSGNNIFGGANVNKVDEKKDTAPTVAVPPFGLFGGGKPAEKKEEAAAAKDGEKKEVSSCTTANVVSAIAIPPPSMLRGKSLEEIVNRWTSDLETNIREFNKFAAEVSVWDRALIENGNNIGALYSHVLAAERQQADINESLEHLEQQQKDLASTLDAYEKGSQEILGAQGGSLRSLDTGPADNERDKNYMLATDLHTHLDDLSGSLTQMIDSVNALSVASRPTDLVDDPMTQISQILSSHLESLQWIDGAVREVENKTNEVEKRVKESGHNLSGSKSRGFGANR